MSHKFFALSTFTLLLLFSPVFAGENSLFAPDHLPFGIPQEPDLLVTRRGFALGYSNKYRQALWVSYILTSENTLGKRIRRSNKFAIDPAVRFMPVRPADYNRSGYDRGHLAPAADMTYSTLTMANSFLMSNISPQIPGCNRGIWKRLETQVRKWALREEKVYIVTGPIFDLEYRAYRSFRLPVPKAFYKVVLDMTPPYKMAAFIVPNSTSKKRISSFAVSVDEVEKATGLDFFSALPDDVEIMLEMQTALDQWVQKP